MSALTRLFFNNALDRPTTWETIEWWESRRIPYNIAVGCAGLVTLSWAAVVRAIVGGDMGIPWQLPIVYGVAANFCYTFGWIAELALGKIVGDQTPKVGATIFRYGFVFSIGLTLLPMAVFTVGLVGHFLGAILQR